MKNAGQKVQLKKSTGCINICVLKKSSDDYINGMIWSPNGWIRQEKPTPDDGEFIVLLTEDDEFVGIYKKTNGDDFLDKQLEVKSDVVLWEKIDC